MDALIFRPEPFGGSSAEHGGCGCSQCKQRHGDRAARPAMEGLAFRPAPFGDRDDEIEQETPWDVARGRKRCTNLPPEVKDCTSRGEDDMQHCKKGSGLKCPPIPELWKSTKVNGAEFFYGPKIGRSSGHEWRCEIVHPGKLKAVELTPNAWLATYNWISAMRAAGMDIDRVYNFGAGPYCRCVKKGKGCGADNAGEDACIGKQPSNHGFGDALDIVGVRWVNKAAVGSSLGATIIHSWKDSLEQTAILVRINAALRTAYARVLDYSDSGGHPDPRNCTGWRGHRNHFHCDTNTGIPHAIWAKREEQNFIIESLVRLGYLTTRKPVEWARAKTGLTAFARKSGLALPADPGDKSNWRAIIQQLFHCMAAGGPAHCRP